MWKKIWLGAFLFSIGIIMKSFKNGEKLMMDEVLLLAGVSLVVFAFKEWVEVPYDWGKKKGRKNSAE